jgi:anti-sigma B factor antagonist
MPVVPLELEHVGAVTVVRVTVRRLLDQAEVDRVRQALLRLADDPGRQLLLDFRAVEALTSTILAALLALRSRLLKAGGRLALCGLRPEIREVFVIASLEGLLNVCPTEQDGLALLQAS